jgi:hypothetical protein
VKFPHFGRFSRDLNGGNGMECQGVVGWPCKFNRSWIGAPPPAGAYTVRLARITLVVVDMEGELPPVICAIFQFGEYSRGNKFVWSGAVLL